MVDTTGAGDAFTAGLVMALAQGGGPQRAARMAVAAAGATVGHPGGRPSLTPKAVQDQLISWSCTAFGVRVANRNGMTDGGAGRGGGQPGRPLRTAILRESRNQAGHEHVAGSGRVDHRNIGQRQEHAAIRPGDQVSASSTASATSEGPWRSSSAAAFSASAAVVTGEAGQQSGLPGIGTDHVRHVQQRVPAVFVRRAVQHHLAADPVRQGRGGERRRGRLLQLHADPPAGQEQVPAAVTSASVSSIPAGSLKVAPLTGGVDDVHDERGAHAGRRATADTSTRSWPAWVSRRWPT